MAVNHESIDTNLLLRLILNDIPAQRIAVKKLLSRENVTFIVEDLAISEIIYVLETKLGYDRAAVVETVRLIMNLPNISCNKTLFNLVLPLYLERPKLSFNDCCLAGYAQLSGAKPLWTFDHKMAMQLDAAKELK